MSLNLGPYMKAINSTVVAVLGTTIAVLADGQIDVKDILSIVITALVVGGGVFFTRNTAKARFAKLFVGGIATLAGVFLSALQDGTDLSVTFIVTAVLTIINGIVVANTSNSVSSDGLEPRFTD